MHAFPRFASRLAVASALSALTLPLLLPLAALADNNEGRDTAVARISFATGNVSVQRGDSSTAVAAGVNAPVLAADYVTTGDRSRAEIQMDGASLVRLGDDVQIRFTHLDPNDREIQLAQGTMELRIVRGTDGISTVDTPSISVRPREAGNYRIAVTSDGQTSITVRSGRADIITPQGTQSVAPGSTLVATGDASNPHITSNEPIALDGFDAFNRDRDRDLERVTVADPYLNSSVQGASDLERYGRWVDDGQYGNVWVPANVAPDWAPYRTGRWVWEGGYGWTWVADEPWGWAPYHYGSWYHSAAYGWAWYPPPVREVPVWRPALVAFFSFGGGDGVSFAFGQNIGWVPLAPFEPYHPWYDGYGGNTTVNTTTVVNTTTNNYYVNNVTTNNLTHVYRNVQVGGVTSVTNQRFTQGRFDHPVVVRASQLRAVQVAHGALPVVPTTNNLRFNDHVVPAVAVRPALLTRSFAGNPSVAQRASFDETRTALATAVHRAPVSTLHYATPAVTSVAPTTAVRRPTTVAPVAPVAPTDSWSRFNTTRGTTVQPQRQPQATYAAPPRATQQRIPETRTVTPTQSVTEPRYAAPPRAAAPQTVAPRAPEVQRRPVESPRSEPTKH